MPGYTPSDVAPNSHSEKQSTESPSPSPPIADATVDSDLKLSRKREREVSVEPATPKTDPLDIDPGRQENRERRTPAKKNRLHLDTTEEEEDVFPGSRTPSHSPPLSTSPPHEVKVRQISQGVEDLTWQNGLKAVLDEDDAAKDPAESDSHDMLSGISQLPLVTAGATSVVFHDSATDSRVSAMVLHEGNPEIITTTGNQAIGNNRSDLDSDCAERDKGLKRKFSSPVPTGDVQKTVGLEQLKRPRDDADKDDNPRETKRPSPPPEQPKSAPVKPPSSASKMTGFMAYASSSSPFASVKGQNIFSTINKTSPSSASPFSVPPSGIGESSTSALEASKTAEAPPKSSSFESFLGSGSSFTSVIRPKSPPLSSAAGLKLHRNNKSPTRRANPANVNAFSSYATGGAHGFHIPKRARAASPSGGSSRSSLERSSSLNVFTFNEDSGGDDDEEDRPVSFGEKLRAGRDDDDEVASDDEKGKLALAQQEVVTGEEDEETIYQVRGKLFSLGSQNQWKERGTGTLKLNVRRFDVSGARLVMRKEAVYTLLLNVTLFAGMRCFLAQDPRYLRFSVIEDGITVHYNLRVASAKIAQELLEEINSNIPTNV